LSNEVFDNYGDDRTVVGFLTAIVYWNVYFCDILPTGTGSLVAVLEDSCGHAYTYQIDGGKVHAIGNGDLHDPRYDHMEVAADLHWQKTMKEPYLEKGNCKYRLRVFPTLSFEVESSTSTPIIFTVCVFCAFLLAAASMVFYNSQIEGLQKKIMNKAKQSGAIVSSLFPAQARRRLYEDADDWAKHTSRNARTGRIRHIEEMDERAQASDPIAFSFPQCTVMFGDIVGFTRWSSKRSPDEVFLLLESLYKRFDDIAERRAVFKVETIGDCCKCFPPFHVQNHLHA
jgi:Adenylate and Guanylate cyclase catalytic domain